MKHLLLTFGSITFLLSFSTAHASFTDVPNSHPYVDAIRYVQEQGIVNGYADGTYRPDALINRAEFAKILEESIPDAEEGVGLCFNAEDFTGFSDVHGEWFWIYTCMQYGRGIVQGYADGSFRPSANINYVEAAKMLYGARHLDNKGILSSPPPSGATWYEPYVEYMSDEDAIPYTIRTLEHLVTRGEMAEMIYRLQTDLPEAEFGSITNLETYTNTQLGFRISFPEAFSYVLEEDPLDHQYEFILSDPIFERDLTLELMVWTEEDESQVIIGYISGAADVDYEMGENAQGEINIVRMQKRNIDTDPSVSGLSNTIYSQNGHIYVFFYMLSNNDPDYVQLIENIMETVVLFDPSPSSRSSSRSSSSVRSSSSSSRQSSSRVSSSSSQHTSSAPSTANTSEPLDLSVSLTGSASIPQNGNIVSYMATLTNHGPADMANPPTVRFIDAGNMTFRSADSDDGCSLDDDDVVCEVGQLASGESWPIVVKYSASSIECSDHLKLVAVIDDVPSNDSNAQNDYSSTWKTMSGCQ